MDHGDTESGNVIVSHSLRDREWISALAIGRLRSFDFCDHSEVYPASGYRVVLWVITVGCGPSELSRPSWKRSTMWTQLPVTSMSTTGFALPATEPTENDSVLRRQPASPSRLSARRLISGSFTPRIGCRRASER